MYRPLRANLKSTSALKLSDFLAARSSLLILRKTSDAAVRVNTQSQVNKVIIGKVSVCLIIVRCFMSTFYLTNNINIGA